jgi:alpha-ribazole phosphatase/probable phosphoglycerate mutase
MPKGGIRLRLRRLLLARHGQTEWNSVTRYQGKTDVPLNETGRLQAERLAARLCLWEPETMFTSSLLRAKETARIVRERLQAGEKPPLSELPELAEIDFGDWEGLTIPEIERLHGTVFAQWREDPSRVVPPGGESFPHVLERVGRALDKILEGQAERILVVGHGGIMRAILVRLLGVPASLVWRMRMDNCCLIGIDFWKDRPMLAFANDFLHLLVPGEEEARALPLPD